jgi:hypothetical protein
MEDREGDRDFDVAIRSERSFLAEASKDFNLAQSPTQVWKISIFRRRAPQPSLRADDRAPDEIHPTSEGFQKSYTLHPFSSATLRF